MIRAYASHGPGQPFEAFEYEPGALGSNDVEIDVLACGICHSDLSLVENDWSNTRYPFVGGHEVVGTVAAAGDDVTHLKSGDTVGLGWHSGACMVCERCMSGDHNLCRRSQATLLGRHGGFAEKVRCQSEFAVRLPRDVDAQKAGPLFCGGITVFNPIVQFDVKPTDRVGVIGIGGLGHLAVQFLAAWGCEVTAFSSSDAKSESARAMGAHHVVNSRDPDQLAGIADSLDFIISTVNVPLDWQAYLNALNARGRFHHVGAVLEPIPVPAFALINGMRSLSGSPVGSPAVIRSMLEFCARHRIEAVTEHFPMSRINDAFEHLAAGKARYRVVLDNDWS